ncbi:MAG: NAD(P)H-dependent oxidoreductase [Clostridiales bacterium]|nr:NAD(P)H-dependent oxidoreductase [Clostridiales bacterium]
MNKKKIVAIVGSFRRDSFNRQLAQKAQEVLGDRAEFEFIEYADVPNMSQDIEFPTPESVRRIREQIKAADGIWIFSPEYNHSYPGHLKNLIDWLSRPVSKEERQVLSRKPIAISGASNGLGGTVTGQDLLVMLLSMLNADVMNFPRLRVPNAQDQADENGVLHLKDSLPYLEKQATAFLKYLDRG